MKFKSALKLGAYETAKANELDPHKYLAFLLEHRPGDEMSDEELDQLAPWGKLAQETCK